MIFFQTLQQNPFFISQNDRNHVSWKRVSQNKIEILPKTCFGGFSTIIETLFQPNGSKDISVYESKQEKLLMNSVLSVKGLK